MPTGGLVIRYPALDKMLSRLDHQYPQLSNQIRLQSAPQSMCGLHAVIGSHNANELKHAGDSLLGGINLLPVQRLSVSVQLILNTQFDVYQPSILKLNQFIDVPPPRLSI
jgi:hypothetical protein